MVDQHTLVVAHECRIASALIPEQCDMSIAAQDAPELGACRDRLEPVECGACSDEIDAGGCERGRFGAAVDGAEATASAEQSLRCLAHPGIRFNGEHVAAGVEEQRGRNAGAGADIRNRGAIAQDSTIAQIRRKRSRIARSVADVVVDAIAESVGRIAGSRQHSRFSVPSAPGTQGRQKMRTARRYTGKR